jgi:hypothetical protein
MFTLELKIDELRTLIKWGEQYVEINESQKNEDMLLMLKGMLAEYL